MLRLVSNHYMERETDILVFLRTGLLLHRVALITIHRRNIGIRVQ